jgi:hypothetical protein
MTLHRIAAFTSVLAVVLLVATQTAWSDVRTWVGGAAGNRGWNVAANWSPPGIPSSTDTVLIANGNLSVFNMASATVAAVTISSGQLSLDKEGGTLIVLGDLHNAGRVSFPRTTTLVVGGDLINAGTFSTPLGTIRYAGGAPQVVAPLTYHNLTLDNVHGCALPDSTTVTGILRLNDGVLSTGPHALNIANPSADAVRVLGGRVAGRVIRSMSPVEGGVYFFGDGPTSIDVVTPGFTSLGMEIFSNTDPPGLTTEQLAQTAKRYVRVSSTGTGVSHLIFHYLDSEVRGTETQYVLWRYNGTAWVKEGGIVDPAANTVTLFDVTTLDGCWAISESGSALPIQLASFNASIVENDDVRLEWMTVSEVNNLGFYIQRRAAGEPSFSELPNSFVAGAGTTIEPQNYTWIDENVPAGSYEFRLRQVDLDGSTTYSHSVDVVVRTPLSVGNQAGISTDLSLKQNFPNPFNPTTTIHFAVALTGPVSVKVYNSLGQEVATLFDATAQAGVEYSTTFNATGLSSGVYFYKFIGESKQETRRMLLVK